MNLHEEALLVRVPIKMRGLTSRSQSLSDEAAEAHEAANGSFNTTVNKFTKDALSAIVSIVNEARLFHLANTLPWADTGYRLIPVTRYAHWRRELERMRNAYMDAVDDLIRNYPALRKEYLKRVNDIAQEVPFPTLEQLKSNFDFQLMEQNIGNPDDLRLKHVDPKTVEELKTKITNSMSDILEEGQKDIINRLFKVVARVHEQTGKEEGRLFKSLITNIEEAVDVLPKLNLKNDPEINRLIVRVRTELASINVENLRTDPKERAKTSKLAGQILSDIKSYGKPQPKKVATGAATSKSIKSRFANVSL